MGTDARACRRSRRSCISATRLLSPVVRASSASAGQLPGKPFIIRQLSWYLRNPLQNFGKYVLGVGDRNYTVVGAAPVYATNWSDVDPIKTGWKISTIRFDWLRLPFVSYENEYLIWQAGWQWSGRFGLKFNIKKSPIQFW
jgi:hypothetical protein